MKYFLFFFLFFPLSTHAKTLVIIGDSLTEGLGVSKDSAYPAILEEKLKENKKDWKVVNSGVSGSTTASAPGRVAWALKSKPDMVMIALGANDGLRGVKVSESKKNLEKALDILKKEKVPVIIAGLYTPPNYGKSYAKDFNQMFSDLSKNNNAHLIPFFIEKVAGIPKYNLADGIHPNEEGHKIIANEMYKNIQGLLK